MQLPEQPKELIQDLNRSYELQLADHLSLDQLEALLAERVNTMIREDFSGLVQWLYRVDVNESKLRQLLRDNEGPAAGGSEAGQGREDAAKIIARLVMERQWQKMETRRKYSRDAGSDEERW
jgi:hypothetical protein